MTPFFRSSIPFLLASYIIPNWDVQKQSEVTYEGLSLDETIEIDKISMQQGINNSIISAYNLADKKYTIKGKHMKIMYVEKNVKSKLKAFNIILLIN